MEAIALHEFKLAFDECVVRLDPVVRSILLGGEVGLNFIGFPII